MITVFTATNDPATLHDAYRSLLAQSHSDWEWVVLANNGAQGSTFLSRLTDARVRIVRQEIEVDRIGALKYQCCKAASGEILVELDHDDLLMPDCLEKVALAFQKTDAGMVYSNTARIDANWNHTPFGDGFGWEYRKRSDRTERFQKSCLSASSEPCDRVPRLERYDGVQNADLTEVDLTEVVSPEPYPQNLSRIWYAPDHVRAWKASEYWRLGGHDQRLKVGDDHDLVCRFWLESEIHHIDDLLYVYRINGSNSWLKHCDLVQEQQWANYERYIERMALKFSRIGDREQGTGDRGRQGELLAIDLCGGIDPRPGFIPVDINGGTGGVEADLNRAWPIATNSVGVIRAMDALEHLRDPIHVMNEAYRVLAHGGFFLIEVPSSDGRGAFQDPTHVSFWNENSFWYYSDRNYQRYITGAGASCRFQVLRLRTYFPNEFCRERNIPYVQAHLVAIKDGPRFHGALMI